MSTRWTAWAAPLGVLTLGVAVGLAGWGVPAQYSRLFGSAMAVAAVMLLLWIQRQGADVRFGVRRRAERVLLLPMIFTGGAAMMLWLLVASHCINEVSTRGEAFYPLWLAGDLAEMVERAGGRVAAIERYGIDAVRLAIANMPGIAIAETVSTVVLLSAYVASFVIPALLLGLLGLEGRGSVDLDSTSVFISYRRNDSSPYARLIHQHLVPVCRRVVLDVDAIEPGRDFVAAIAEAIGASDAAIIVIGRAWMVDESGNDRFREPADMVYFEVERSLALGLAVLPVLVDGARMPSREELPDSLKPLASLNALTLGHATFGQDMRRLMRFLANVPARRIDAVRQTVAET